LQPLPVVFRADRIDRRRVALVSIDLVKLRPLMARTDGTPALTIALVDGPVAVDHPALAGAHLRGAGDGASACSDGASDACVHGTLVAGVLVASRESGAPGICPRCVLVVRPIFRDTAPGIHRMPAATADQLADAIVDCVDAGARVVNVSAALTGRARGERRIADALELAARRGSLVVVAAGNDASIGSSAVTRHPWVLPVLACDAAGRPGADANVSRSIAVRGVLAPGENIRSLRPDGAFREFSGTSAAAPFVTGTAALLWSLFPAASASDVRLALTQMASKRRTQVVPPLLDASSAFAFLSARYSMSTS
jgi:subtilisin family serine protease